MVNNEETDHRKEGHKICRAVKHQCAYEAIEWLIVPESMVSWNQKQPKWRPNA